MNETTYNNTTQTLNISYTLIQPVIPGKQITFETTKQQVIWHYEDFILSIMKVMDLQYITHYTNNEYQLIIIHGVVLKHKNVSSIEEYNIGDRLKYSRIKQSSKKDIEESRINVKYQEHYRSIWNSAKCKMQSAKYKVQSAKCKVQYRNFWNNAKY